MPNQIRTLLRDEYPAQGISKERGSRYWTAAEVSAPIWFVVESCIEVSEKFEIQRWVTTSIQHAASIQRGFEPSVWSQIFVCMRAPLSVRNATVFEVVNEAYKCGAGFVYRLANGMSFMTGNEGILLTGSEPTELELVYAHGR